MRVSLFVSALFAASLFGGAVMADQPGEGGGRTTRLPNAVRELKVHQVREVREARPHETPQTKVHNDNKVTERLRSRGDMVDRTSTKSKVARETSSAKSQKDMIQAARHLNDRERNSRNCAPTDDSCASYGRATGAAKADAAKSEAQKSNQQRELLRQQVEKVRIAKMKQRILAKFCERNANMCEANL